MTIRNSKAIWRSRVLRGLALGALAGALWAQDAAAVLARMDASAAGFRSASADLVRVTHTAVINEDLTESGQMRLLRSKAGVQLLIEFNKPDAKSYAFQGRKAEVYYPKIKTVQEYDVGKQRGLVEQFILLGFGSPGKEISRGYAVKYLGEDAVAGQKASRIELTPKSDKTKEYFTKVELWINAEGRPARQKFYQTSGDTTTVTYSKLVWNPAMAAGDVALKLPPDTRREYPQK